MSTFQDLPKYNCYQNLTHLKNQSGAATIYGRTEQCKYGETTNQMSWNDICQFNSIQMSNQVEIKESE